MNEFRLKHLEMVQAVINRLAGNSFTLKSWTITIASVLLALSLKDANPRYAFVALFPAVCFWGLDAYYLRQERLFRALHEAVSREIGRPVEEQGIPLFSLDATPVAGKVESWIKVLWSPTVIWLHGSILVVVIAVSIYSAMR